MGSIKDLLSKYKLISPPDEVVRNFAVKILRDEIGLCTSISNIKMSAGVIFVRVDPSYKSEILRLKPKLINLFIEEFGVKAPKDIK